jgi:hypothetical protein
MPGLISISLNPYVHEKEEKLKKKNVYVLVRKYPEDVRSITLPGLYGQQ